jgi:hypothetical protein
MNGTIPRGDRVFDYKVQRRIVGAIALVLAPLVTWLAGGPLDSISASYWTGAIAVFVGSLCAVAVFLAAYNGQGAGWDLEFWLAKAAGVLALLVALFPTAGHQAPPTWTSTVAGWFGMQPTNVHYGAAIFLFSALTGMMYIFSTRARRKGHPSRALLYVTISGFMAVGLLMGLASWIFQLGKESDLTYWIEFWILFWFGTGWLIAGWYKEQDGNVGETE